MAAHVGVPSTVSAQERSARWVTAGANSLSFLIRCCCGGLRQDLGFICDYDLMFFLFKVNQIPAPQACVSEQGFLC